MKQNKSKAKREAKAVAKQAGKPAIRTVLVGGPPVAPPPLLVGVTKILQPVCEQQQPLEAKEALDMFAVALTRLRIYVGDGDDMAMVYSRIMFGRRLAHRYFDDQIAENLHHAVQTCIISANDQYVPGQHPQVMSLDAEAGQEVSEALNMCELLAQQMNREEYLRELIAHDAEVNNITSQMQLQSWEDYLATVGTA